MKLIIRWRPLVLLGPGLLGLLLRLYGLNWDQGNSFHPDERQILFHVTALSWPHSFAQFLNPELSPLNPRFFAYGSFPMYLLALVGTIFLPSHAINAPDSFFSLTLIGRVISAIFDSGTVILTGWLGLLLSKDTTPSRRYGWWVAWLAAALVAFTPFQLQLSHFYAVDTMLLFFVVLTLLACVALVDTEKPVRWLIVAGIAYGLALATKFSAAPLAVPIVVALLLYWYRHRDWLVAVIFLFFTSAVTVLVFFITQPYALLDMKNYIQQVSDQGSLARGSLDLPYVRQFAGTVPFLYEGYNILLWGLGLMLGLASIAGLLWLLWRIWKRDAGPWLVILSWVLVYGAITGSFYVKFMRYMLPIYPLLTVIAAAALITFLRYTWNKRDDAAQAVNRLWAVLSVGLIVFVLGGTMFQGLALLNVYSQPNTRVLASRWMYSHIKLGSILTYEQWDDALPVPVGSYNPSLYMQYSYVDPEAGGQAVTGLDLYGDDTAAKAHALALMLPKVDAITMPTDRLDKSIPRLPARYPLTIHYYQLLFSGQLGYHLAAQFENHPNLLGVTLDDSSADESYSVFDHPHVRIFVRDNPYPYTSDQLYQLLMKGVQLPPT